MQQLNLSSDISADTTLKCLDDLLTNKDDKWVVNQLFTDTDFASGLDQHLTEVVDFLCEQLINISLHPIDEAKQSVVIALLNQLPLRFDPGECLLLLTGQFRKWPSNFHSFHLLKPLSMCVLCFSPKHFARVRYVLDELTTTLGSLCSTDVSKQTVQKLMNFVQHVVSFYEEIVPYLLPVCNSDSAKTELVIQHLFFLLTQPSILLNDLKDSVELKLRIFHVIVQLDNGIYSKFCSQIQKLSRDEDILCVGQTVPPYFLAASWLNILSTVVFESTFSQLNNSWPTIFSKLHYVDDVCRLCTVLLYSDFQSKPNEVPSADKPIQHPAHNRPNEAMFVQFKLYAMKYFQNFTDSCNQKLHRSWWSPNRIGYLRALEKLATQPISGASLPNHVILAITSFDQLVNNSTYSAMYNIFTLFLNTARSSTVVHHGWRGHLITRCKDYIHQVWSTVSSNDIETGEMDHFLLTDQSSFARLCHLIFIYPLPLCKDDLVDQSSWLLSALNMILYVAMRLSNLSLMLDTEYEHVFSGLLRPTGCSRYCLFTYFIDPLTSELSSTITCKESQAHVISNSLNANCDPTESTRLQSEMKFHQTTLLRLRLLQATLDRVKMSLKPLVNGRRME